MCDFFEELPPVFHSCCTTLHGHQHGTVFKFSYISPTLIIFSFFLMITIPLGVRWNLSVVLLCVSPVTDDIGHFFVRLLAIHTSSLRKYLLRSSAYFLIELFILCCGSSICILSTLINNLQIFSNIFPSV